MEAIRTQAARSAAAAELTRETRTRVAHLLEAVDEDRVDVDQRNFAIRDATGAKFSAKFRAEDEIEITNALRDHALCRVAIDGVGEFSARDGSLRKVVRIDRLERRSVSAEDEYDESAPPLWESVIAIGAGLPAEEWDCMPSDLAANLDHYLYRTSRGRVRRVFADAGYWIALLNPKDGLHAKASAVSATLGGARIVTSEMVLTEVLNAFAERRLAPRNRSESRGSHPLEYERRAGPDDEQCVP